METSTTTMGIHCDGGNSLPPLDRDRPEVDLVRAPLVGALYEEAAMSISRREVLTGIAVGAPVLLAATTERSASAETADPQTGGAAPVFAGKHAVAPLPFDPKKLSGLSEKMIVSHHDNNYAGAIKNLNKVEENLASVTKDTPGFVVSGLKERELTFTNSAILHEHYFGNLGGNGKASGS